MVWNVKFYQKDNGNIPVLDFLNSLEPKMRAKVYSEIKLLEQFGIMLREPYASPIKGKEYKGLYELRTKFATDITRVFYFLYEKNNFVLLHGFTKKSNKTPTGELEIAKNRMEDYKTRKD